MKERIKELAVQAGLEFDDSFALEPEPIYYCTQTTLEKLAELIVQDCADLFEVEWGEAKLTGNDVGYVVKKHFGVESQP